MHLALLGNPANLDFLIMSNNSKNYRKASKNKKKHTINQENMPAPLYAFPEPEACFSLIHFEYISSLQSLFQCFHECHSTVF